jgi:PAS domain S-box-containing protein
MLTRTEVSGTQCITYTQAWDAENCLSMVTNTVAGQSRACYTELPAGACSDVLGGIMDMATAAYAYTLLMLGAFWLVQTALRSSQLYRRQVGALIVGATLPWLGNVLCLFNLTPWPGLDPTPVAFMLTGLATAWGLYRFQMFNLVPIVRNALIENMNDGVFVLDDRNRIVDINPAACRTFGCSATSAVGQPMAAILTKWPDLVKCYRDMPEARAEIAVNETQPVRDTGPGIPDQIRNRSFQQFVRGKQIERGSGLGLVFCRLVVEAHGGRIAVDSVPGRGTPSCSACP